MTVINSNAYAVLGVQYTFWAALSGTYPMGTTGTLANGASAGMGRLRGVSDVNITMPVGETIYPPGDNGVVTAFKTLPTELPSGTMTLAVLDQLFAAKSNGAVVYADGDWDEIGDGQPCYNFNDICLVFNSPANAQESSNLDEAGWVVTEVYKIQNQASILAQMQTGAAVSFPNQITCKRATANLVGRAFSTVNDGSTSFVVKQYMSDYPVTYHTLVGDASVDEITLNETPAAATINAVQVWIAGVKKAYTTDYTVTTATKLVSLVAAPGSGVKTVVKYKFVPTC